MNESRLDAMEQRLIERIESGDKANKDRVDQLYIYRSEDLAEQREFRAEMRVDHRAVVDALRPLPQLIAAVEEITRRLERHDVWHGPDDSNIMRRLQMASQAALWRGQWAVIIAAVVVGGALAGIIDRIIGWVN